MGRYFFYILGQVMATALNIIERALRSIGVLATGEVASADMANDALVSLNDVIAGMANESLTIYQNTQDVLPLTGAQSYTYGLTGVLNSVRPIRVDTIFYRDANNNDFPVQIISQEEYNGILKKSTTSSIPAYVYVETSYPLAVLHVYPAVTGGTLYIYAEKPLTAFAALTTTVALPSGYERMLRYALAAEVMTEYGVDNQAIAQKAIESKADLKRTNYKPKVMRVSLPFGGRSNVNSPLLSGLI